MQRAKRLQLLDKDTVYTKLSSPIGELTVLASSLGIHCVFWDSSGASVDADIKALFKPSVNHPILKKAKQQLKEYFAGCRREFDLPLVVKGTVFQQQAWRELSQIPYGETISYGEQARRLGDSNKARAVGMANGQNPIPIIIPCHRVIGSNGKLTGFTGGLDKKSYLLALENQSN